MNRFFHCCCCSTGILAVWPTGILPVVFASSTGFPFIRETAGKMPAGPTARMPVLLGRRFLRAQAGIRAHAPLREPRFRARLAPQEGAEDCAKESQRNAEDARVLERKYRRTLNEMARRRRRPGRIHLHDARADNDEDQRSDEPGRQTQDRAAGVESLPEK